MSAAEKRVEQLGLARVDIPTGLSPIAELAIQHGAPIEVMERIFALEVQVSIQRARAAFFEALTAFRAECPPIQKTRENTQFQVTRDGVKRNARYAPLEEIDRVARPVAARHGLVWTWDTRVDGELMHITCRLKHVMGHTEDTNVTMPHGSSAGSSPQQKFGSTQTYGMRYSLIAALGLTTSDEDVDGNDPTGDDSQTGDRITVEQAKNIERLLTESGTRIERFLARFKIESVASIPARWYDRIAGELSNLAEQRRAP